ncbi:MAG: glycosyltransferase family 39 protein [Planctomycetota bacterium]
MKFNLMKNTLFSNKIILIIILFIAVLARSYSLTAFMHKYHISVHENGLAAYPQIDDSQLYYHTAVNLSEGKGYTFTITDAFRYPVGAEAFKPSPIPGTYYNNHYPPLYSFFLSILYRVFGTSILVYAVPQIILGTFSCYLTYILAKEAFSSTVGLIAGFLLSIYPPIVWWTSYLRSENLFIPLQLLTILFLIRAAKNNLEVKNTVLSGIFCAISFLCRNVALYLPVFIVFYFLIVFFKKAKKKLLTGIILFLLAFYLPLLPWGYRNYTTYGTFSVTTVEDWDAFYMLNNEQEARAPLFELYRIKYDPTVNIDLSSGEKELASKSFVKQHPLKYAKLCLKRFLAYWGPTTQKPSLLKKIADTLVYIVVFPMAFWGFYRSRWWSFTDAGFKPIPALLITVILYYTTLHSLVSVDDGLIYRYPIIPLICIFSAYGFYTYFKRSAGVSPAEKKRFQSLF